MCHEVFSRLFSKKEMRILMVGLDVVGKTTILYKVKLGEIVTTISNIGFNVENISFTVWDVGVWTRLIDERKLMDALALSDRFLRNGASDQLLQLLIERGEEDQSISGQSQSYGGHSIWSNSWQDCLRLKDKRLAARLALKLCT